MIARDATARAIAITWIVIGGTEYLATADAACGVCDGGGVALVMPGRDRCWRCWRTVREGSDHAASEGRDHAAS